MRAFVLTEFGVPPAITDIMVPEPTAEEVRVRVLAASVNGFDVAVAAGHMNGSMEHRFPVVLGSDFAGVVDAVGTGVTEYAVGDRVFGVVSKPYLGDGSLAEYVTVPVALGLARLPESVDFADGAGLGLAGAAAQAALDAAELQTGQKVLVSGATGGVGNQVVQLAKNAGATVVATAATDEEVAHVTTLGADLTVDHTHEDLVEAVRAHHPDGLDVVFHLAGDPTALLGALRPGGRIVSTLISSPDQLPSEEALVIGVMATPDSATLDQVASDHADGVTGLRIQDTYTLEQTADAFAAFGAGTLGKVVVTTT